MKTKTVVGVIIVLVVLTVPIYSAQDEGSIIINPGTLYNGATYWGIREITITASHPDGIWFIRLNIGGQNVEIAYASTLRHAWDTTVLPDGTYHIQITAAVNATLFRWIDIDVFVNNSAAPTVLFQDDFKLGIITVVTGVYIPALGILIKSEIIESQKRKAIAFIIGILIFTLGAISFWIFL